MSAFNEMIRWRNRGQELYWKKWNEGWWPGSLPI